MSSSCTAADAAVARPAPVSLANARLGWIGCGVMGASMAGHVRRAFPSNPLTVYNRSPEKCASLVAAGASQAFSVEEVAQQSDIVFSIVAFPADVRAVYLGRDNAKGLLDVLKPGSIVIDMVAMQHGHTRSADAINSLHSHSLLPCLCLCLADDE